MSEIIVNSPLHGTHIVLIDDEDMPILNGMSIYVWTTSRHHTLYAMTTVNKKTVRIHRLIMSVTDPKLVVDHINGNGLDNRRCNLRITTQKGNNCNARKRKSAQTSKHKGVHFDRTFSKWKAQIQHDKKKYTLGTFPTEEEAALAYNQAVLKYFGEYAVLNIVETK